MTQGRDEVFDNADVAPGDEHVEGGVGLRILGYLTGLGLAILLTATSFFVLALAFGILIVILVMGGSLWIMANLNHNMMPMDQLMQMQR
jgi:cytochrome o ubiquinol oxidase operon protein cyoD